MNQLIDSYGRVHRDLRVSLTDRCSLRCTYCMPHDFNEWLPSQDLLSTDELIMIVDVATQNGITEVRLTGGEPLLRLDIVEIVARIRALPNAPELSLTTNGLQLKKYASALVDAGLTRVNVSLDTLNKDTFKQLTYRDRIDDVFAGLEAAKSAGLSPIKINSVLMRDVNESEALSLLNWAISNGYALRFIEQMPLDAGGIWNRSTMVTSEEIQKALSLEYSLTPIAGRGSSPAEEFLLNNGPEKVGIIASVSVPFCGACDRLRLTSDGQIRSCLFSTEETDLRSLLRNPHLTSEEIQLRIAKNFDLTVKSKLPGHGINDLSFIQPQRPMSAIGG